MPPTIPTPPAMPVPLTMPLYWVKLFYYSTGQSFTIYLTYTRILGYSFSKIEYIYEDKLNSFYIKKVISFKVV